MCSCLTGVFLPRRRNSMFHVMEFEQSILLVFDFMIFQDALASRGCGFARQCTCQSAALPAYAHDGILTGMIVFSIDVVGSVRLRDGTRYESLPVMALSACVTFSACVCSRCSCAEALTFSPRFVSREGQGL